MATVIETVVGQMKKSYSYGQICEPIAAWVKSGNLKDLKKVKSAANFAWLEPATLALVVGDDSEQCHRLLAACLKSNDAETVCHWMKRRLASSEKVLVVLNLLRE